MEPAEQAVTSIRFTRAETRRVVWALVLSLLLHLLGWGLYELGKKQDWWNWARWPHWMHQMALKVQPPPPPPPPPPSEPALSFLDVSQPSPDAPDKALYYSDKNSRAANAKILQDANQPDIEGHQKEVPKTEDVTRPVLTKNPPNPKPVSKPSPDEQSTPVPPSQEQQQKDPENKPRSLEAGDLTKGKPTPTDPQPENTKPQQARPRSLKQALAQLSRRTPGQAILMPGGVHRIALTSSLDAKATPFGAYDAALVDAVTQQWWNMLDNQQFAQDRTGAVTVHFRLNEDGTVTEVEMPPGENNVGDLLGFVCIAAVQKAAPFAPWPSDMRKMVGANFRDITFTFHYY